MVDRKRVINYYKVFNRKTHEWCILSFVFSNPVVADRIAKSLIFYDCAIERISPERFLDYRLRYFSIYRIGAIRFDCGSRDPVRYSHLFKYRFTIGYVDSSQTCDGIHSRFLMPFSSDKENVRRVYEGVEDGVLSLWDMLELHPRV